MSFAWYPTSVLVIPGLAWTAIAAARANRRELANWWTRREDEIAAALPFKGPTMLLQSEVTNQLWISTDEPQADDEDLAPHGSL